jgi:hypothetical protein
MPRPDASYRVPVVPRAADWRGADAAEFVQLRAPDAETAQRLAKWVTGAEIVLEPVRVVVPYELLRESAVAALASAIAGVRA